MNRFPITGSFIDEKTYDIPSSNWTDEQWVKEMDFMQQVGIDTLIFIRGVFYDYAIYPSKVFKTLKKESEDLPRLIMEQANKRNMNVFMGMYISDLNWNNGDYLGEISKNKKFIAEIIQRYGDMPSFKGWYIPHEASCNEFNIKETMGGLAALCKDKTPDKKVLISPFYNTIITTNNAPYSPQRTFDEWNNILEKSGKDIDICAFQDGTAPLDEYENYLIWTKKLLKEHDIAFWANVETFERDVRRMYYPITFELLRRKIEIAEKYVEKMITFEFSHFLSPQSIYPSARNLNTLYSNYYDNRK